MKHTFHVKPFLGSRKMICVISLNVLVISKKRLIPTYLAGLAFLMIPRQPSHDFAARWIESRDVETGIVLTIGQSDHS